MPNIRHRLLIEAPAEKIYNGISTQEGLSAWWTPGTTAKADLNSVARFPFGTNYFKEMKIVELKPFTQIRWVCIEGTEEWIGTTLSFDLEPVEKDLVLKVYPEMAGQLQQARGDKGTVLIFHHDGWRDDTPMLEECNYTWALFLRSLKLFCETEKGLPYPTQHRLA